MGRPLRLIEPDAQVERIVREHGPISAHEIAEKLAADGYEWPTPAPYSRYGSGEYGRTRPTAAHVNGSLKHNWDLQKVKPAGRPPQWEYAPIGRR